MFSIVLHSTIASCALTTTTLCFPTMSLPPSPAPFDDTASGTELDRMDYFDLALRAHTQAQLDDMDLNTPIPSMAPPQPSQLQDESGPSNSPEFYLCQVFMGTPLPSTTPTVGLPADTATAGRVSTAEWLDAR
jgi:hypothetical protein